MGERASGIGLAIPYSGLPFWSAFHLAHHGLLDLIEVDFDGVAAGLGLGSGPRYLFGLGPVDGHLRLSGKAAFQRIDQAVERRIGQRDPRSLVEASQSDGLVGI